MARSRSGSVGHEAAARTGHTEISWSIVLQARLREMPPLDEAERRLSEAWPRDRAGAPPPLEMLPEAVRDDRVRDAADRPYGPDEPLCRVLVFESPAPSVVIAGHHAILDGLGLVSVLLTFVGQPISTATRGIEPDRPARRGGVAYAIGRLAEAALHPPDRVAAEPGAGGTGDHLVAAGVSVAVDSASLVAASVRAVRNRNRRRGDRGGRLVVAVGASRRAGRSASLDDAPRRSAWFRIRITDLDPNAIRDQLRRQPPEPTPVLPALAPAAGWLGRGLASRLGSTLLVSNLGRLEPHGPVTAAAFYPSAHGRSGLSVGCVTVDETTTVTVRARRRDYTEQAAADLLADITGSLASPGT